MARTRSADCTDYDPCGRCEYCQGIREANRLTPEQRAQVIGADAKGIKEIKPGENAGITVPMNPPAVADAERVSVDFVAIREPMAEYELEDGTRIRAKSILMRVDRLVGIHQPDGSPVYQLVWNQVMDTVPGKGGR